MENSTKIAIDVLGVTPKINNSLVKSLDIVSSSGYLIDNGKIVGNSIWDLPLVLDYFEADKANKELLKVVSDHILVCEKLYPTLGKAMINSIVYKGLKISPLAKRLSVETIISEIKKNNFDSISNNIIDQIIKHGNPSLSISINRRPIEKPIVKFVSLPTVKLKIADRFESIEKDFNNCKFFMLDGAVSKASEITKLLNYSFEHKDETIFLVCKSFNDEVLYTLQENYTRNLTKIIPIQYGFDLESINSLADLCAVVGGMPYTPMMGDVLISADLDRMGEAEYCKLGSNKICIKSTRDFSYHRVHLSRKIEDAGSDQMKRFLSERLTMLSGNSCQVKLPQNQNYDKVENDIKYFILLLNSLSKNKCIICEAGNKKFYITDQAARMIDQSLEKINQILSTKIVLKRSIRCRQKSQRKKP